MIYPQFDDVGGRVVEKNAVRLVSALLINEILPFGKLPSWFSSLPAVITAVKECRCKVSITLIGKVSIPSKKVTFTWSQLLRRLFNSSASSFTIWQERKVNDNMRKVKRRIVGAR